MFQTIQIAVGGFDSNFSYVISGGEDLAVVDPCGDVSKIKRVLAGMSGIPKYILITHGHADHVSGLAELSEVFPGEVVRHPENGRRLPFGAGFIECLRTPGHSRDSVCYRLSDDSAIFTGDTLFIDCIGFCEPESMFRSLAVLKNLNPELVIYSGHDYGHVPAEKMREQLKTNPYLAAEDFPSFRKALESLE